MYKYKYTVLLSNKIKNDNAHHEKISGIRNVSSKIHIPIDFDMQ